MADPALSLLDVAFRHQVFLEGLKAGQRKQVTEFLKQVSKDARKRLAPIDLQSLTKRRLIELISKINEDTGKSVDGFITNILDEMDELAQVEAAFAERTIKELATEVTLAMPSTQQLHAAVFNNPLSFEVPGSKNTLGSFIKGAKPRTINRIQNAIQTGYYQGESTFRILQRIRGTKASGFTDGILKHIDNDLNSVVRTAIQHTAVQARQRVTAGNKDLFDGIVWVSVLDNRTSQQCRSLDGLFFAHGEGPRPPLHLNCRSTYIDHFKKSLDFLNEQPTRAARDMTGIELDTHKKRQAFRKRKALPLKKVKGDTTYYQMLKNEPASVQKAILLPTRYKLFKAAGMTPEAFAELNIGTDFQPLTLKQMVAKNEFAFTRAGLNPDDFK